MILLLSGGTTLARTMLVEEFQKNHPDWRHIAIEDLASLPFLEGAEEGERMKLAVSLAVACAKEMIAEKTPILLSCSDAGPYVEQIREETGNLVRTVHIGPPEEAEGFDHAIQTLNRSVSDLAVHLWKIASEG